MAQIANGWRNNMICLDKECGGHSFEVWTFDYNRETQARCNGCGQYYDVERPDKLGDLAILTKCEPPIANLAILTKSLPPIAKEPAKNMRRSVEAPKEEPKNWDGLLID